MTSTCPNCGPVFVAHRPANKDQHMAIDDENDYSLTIPTPQSSLSSSDSPLQVSTPLNIRPPLTNALDTANTLLSAATTSSDFTFQYSLISRALAIGQSIAGQIVNPLSVFRPGRDEIASTKRVLLFSHAAMVQFLCRQSYTTHCEEIYQHLSEIIRMQAYQSQLMDDPRLKAAFEAVKDAVDSSGLSLSERIIEWRRIVDCICVPDDPYFIPVRFWSHMSVLKMEMENMEVALSDGELEEVKRAVIAQQEVVERFTENVDNMATLDQNRIRQMFHGKTQEWRDRDPCQLNKIGHHILARFHKVRLTVEAQGLLRQGDVLLSLATERAKELDVEYFKFQAILALDSYRAAYHICVGFEDVNVELEGLCLWSMGRVMGTYLGLEEHAHHLYLHGVAMVAQVTALVPNTEWYADSVAQIQCYRKKMEMEEMRRKERERAGMMDQLILEVMELQSRAAFVVDNNSLREFFGWLLRTHPPRHVGNKDVMRGILEAREICKVVLNVIALYDVRDCDDEEWVVFCEEIIKVIQFDEDLLIIDCQSIFWELWGRLFLSIILGLFGVIALDGQAHSCRAYGFEGIGNCNFTK